MHADGFTLRWKLLSVASDPSSRHTETVKVRSVKRLPTESTISSLLPTPSSSRKLQFLSLDPQTALSMVKIYLNASFAPSGAMVCRMLSYKCVQSICRMSQWRSSFVAGVFLGVHEWDAGRWVWETATYTWWGPKPDNEHSGGSGFQCGCTYGHTFIYVYNALLYIYCVHMRIEYA